MTAPASLQLADNRNPAKNVRMRHGRTMLISAGGVKDFIP
jgi:hypothetical protein